MDPAERTRLAGQRRSRPSIPSRSRWAKFARQVVDHYGGLCWCGHGGAKQADHVISVAERPDLAWKMENCRPAHGAPGNPCLVCSSECGQPVYCNQLRGPLSIDRALRIIAEKREAHQRASGKTPLNAETPGTRVSDPDAGRPW